MGNMAGHSLAKVGLYKKDCMIHDKLGSEYCQIALL